MNERIQQLIDELVQRARMRGMTQAELARRAGISPVGLSKAKQRGDLRASTLDALAAVVDLELALQPRRPRAQLLEAIRRGRLFGDEDDV